MNKYRNLLLQKNTITKKDEYKYFVGTTIKNSILYDVGE